MSSTKYQLLADLDAASKSYQSNYEGLFLRCLKPLDERVSVKLLLRVWGPRFEFIVRLIFVATFLDDSFRAATHFSEHIDQVGQGCLWPLAATSPGLVSTIAMIALSAGLLAQSLGSFCLLAMVHPDSASKALICWTIAQPVLYAQLANVQFVAESLSMVGGLLILRAHLSNRAEREGRHVPLGGGGLCLPGESEPQSAIARTQLLGRLLLLSVYVHRAWLVLRGLLQGHSLSMLLVDIVVLVGLVLGCTLVAAGLRSRTVALSLALVNLGFVCYSHPFFAFVWREGGKWKYDDDALRKSMPHVAIPENNDPDDFESWHIVDLHRYYFFQGLSTSGALLLLAQFGPGEIAVEAGEMLLGDVQRARD